MKMNRVKPIVAALIVVATSCISAKDVTTAPNYNIVDTGQSKFFDDKKEIEQPKPGEPFYGQDAQYTGNVASYKDNGDGTILDQITGLMWQKDFAVMSYEEALKTAESLKLAGYTDWRVPTIEEAYSLMLFSGSDVNPQLSANSKSQGVPFIDTKYFAFEYAANGNRAIDSQMLSSTRYVGSTERENLVFGVNFADGRIKGYGMRLGASSKNFMVRFVRGVKYGVNDFKDNGDGTISDVATSLMWSREDSGKAMNWEQALQYAQKMNAKGYLGYADWRVPNAKELQSLVDYTRSPLSSNSAAIDPMFSVSTIKDESGAVDYPFYWSSTTHENSGASQGGAGVYVAFGRSLGNMSNSVGVGQQGGGQQRPQGQQRSGQQGQQRGGQQGQQALAQQGGGQQRQQMQQPRGWVDIHGAGSQRSDPKSGDASRYANGHGPQGDAIRINNYVRIVRNL